MISPSGLYIKILYTCMYLKMNKIKSFIKNPECTTIDITELGIEKSM